ncbi:unnamed protein product [Orchesella dallaii]|uniref:Uncharacterized protein n=1 Tax=Orchesella dallaii TaxID=48710 RepID=A0ABP1RUW2_9HEXA
MADVKQRSANHTKLKNILKVVRDHPNTPLTFDTATTWMERTVQAMDDCTKAHTRCKDHRLADCPSKKTCRKCSRKHNTLLNEDRSGNNNGMDKEQNPPAIPPPVIPPPPMNTNHVSLET